MGKGKRQRAVRRRENIRNPHFKTQQHKVGDLLDTMERLNAYEAKLKDQSTKEEVHDGDSAQA